MERLAAFLLRHKAGVLIAAAVLLAVSILLALTVNVSYDLTGYLPDDAPSTRALKALKADGGQGVPNLSVYVPCDSIPEALEYKRQLGQVEGVYSVLWLDDTVDVSGEFTVMAPGIAMVEAARDDKAIFRVADGAKVAFAHVFFKGGLHHLACEVDGGATLALDSCLSFDSEKAAFLMNTRGDPAALRFRIDGGVHYNPVWYEGNADVILAGAWMRILPPKPYGEPYNESCAVVNFGRMRYQDILGVPCVFAGIPKASTENIPPGDYRWIDNRGGELHSLFSRFGGEWGGIPPVYSYDGGKVLIEGGYGYFYPRYTAHQPIVTDGVPADLRLFGMSCGFEVQVWYGGLKFMRRTPSGTLEPIPGAKVRGNVPRVPVGK